MKNYDLKKVLIGIFCLLLLLIILIVALTSGGEDLEQETGQMDVNLIPNVTVADNLDGLSQTILEEDNNSEIATTKKTTTTTSPELTTTTTTSPRPITKTQVRSELIKSIFSTVAPAIDQTSKTTNERNTFTTQVIDKNYELVEKSTLDKILSILEQTTEDKFVTSTTTEETTADSYRSTFTETEREKDEVNFRTTEREVIELDEILTTATENGVEKTTAIEIEEEEEETTFPWMDLEKDNEITTQQINQIKSTENPGILDIILNTEDTRILDKFLQTLQTTTDLTTTELEFEITEQEEEKLTTFLATTQKILINPTTIDQRIPTTKIPLKETTQLLQEETTVAGILIEETSFIDWERFFEEDPNQKNNVTRNFEENNVADQNQIFTTSTAIRFITEELELAQQNIYEISTTSFPDFATSESNRQFFNEQTTDGNWFIDTTAVGQWE